MISEDRDDGWHETFGGRPKHEGCYCEAHANNPKKYGNQNHRNRSQSLYKTTFAASLLRVLSFGAALFPRLRRVRAFPKNAQQVCCPLLK